MGQKGLVHVYYGDGKGKTTCAMGLCVRAAGAGMRVLIYQFMKDGLGNERSILEALPNVRFANQSRKVKFSFRMDEEEKRLEREFCEREFERIMACLQQENVDVLLLDEVLYAVSCGFLPEQALTGFLDGKPECLEVILTGREASEAVIMRADYVSRICKEKHPYDRGIVARNGIER